VMFPSRTFIDNPHYLTNNNESYNAILLTAIPLSVITFNR